MKLTNERLSNLEDSVIDISLAFGVSEQKALDIIETGCRIEYQNEFDELEEVLEIIKELRAVFDAY